MDHERWFRGQHDGLTRPFDWLTAARGHGIPDKLARVLYEQAMLQAHGATEERVQELYLALLLVARRDAARPSPGKVTRTMRLQAHQAGKRPRPYMSRLTGQPIAPGKCTLTSYLEPAIDERRCPEKEGDVGWLFEQDISVPDTLLERRLHAYLAAAAGHFEELDALNEMRVPTELASAAEAARASELGSRDTAAAEVNGWQLPAGLQLRLESLVGAGRPVDGSGVAAPMQAAGLQGTPEAVRLPGHGSGEVMPEDVRRKMEAAFGVDFSSVRIHQGPHAAAVGARAYTQGTDIHFAPGQYQPQSQRGLELLGHELTHVVQQSQGRVQPTARADGINVNADASLEREANEMGAWVARGGGAHEPSPWPDGMRFDGSFRQQSDANLAFAATSEGNPSLQVTRRDAAPRPRNELQPRNSAHGEVQQRALDDVPETQRHALMVGNAVDGFPAGQIQEWFSLAGGRSQPVNIRRPRDEMTFSGELGQAPEHIRTGLGSVAVSLMSRTIEGRHGAPARSLLSVGTTLEVNLMLQPYGGQDGRYRFTRYQVDAQTTILVEFAGSIPAAATAAQVPNRMPFTVGASTFHLEGAWNSADYALLREALELLPSAALHAADGLHFRRMTGSATGSEAGRYQTASDTIELFQDVFTTQDPRGRAREPRTCTGGRREGDLPRAPRDRARARSSPALCLLARRGRSVCALSKRRPRAAKAPG